MSEDQAPQERSESDEQADPLSIRKHGWEQGSVLPEELLSRMRKDDDSRVFPHALKERDQVVGIVLSQTCDVVHRSFDLEPYVEILWGILLQGDPDPGFSHVKSIRTLHLPIKPTDSEKEHATMELSIHDRTRIDRRLFCNFSPHPSWEVPERGRREILHWVRLRYDRSAWPDSFNERIRPEGKTIRKLLKKESASHLSGIFLTVFPDEELPPEKSYDVVVKGLMHKKEYDDGKKREGATILLDNLGAILDKCTGMNVMDSFCKSEEQETLTEYRKLKRWTEFDDLTLRDSSSDDIAPDP